MAPLWWGAREDWRADNQVNREGCFSTRWSHSRPVCTIDRPSIPSQRLKPTLNGHSTFVLGMALVAPERTFVSRSVACQ